MLWSVTHSMTTYEYTCIGDISRDCEVVTTLREEEICYNKIVQEAIGECLMCYVWLHRQGYCLACWGLQGWFPAEAVPIHTLHRALRGYCIWGWGVWPVNWMYHLWCYCCGCGQLQLGVPHWATSVDYCK